MPRTAAQLPFGNDRALVFRSEAECVAAAERLNWPLNEVSFQSGAQPYVAFSGARVGDLLLRALYSTPGIYASSGNSEFNFQIPLLGSGVTHYGARSTPWSAAGQIQMMSLDRSFRADVSTSILMIVITPSETELSSALTALSTGARDLSELVGRVQEIGNCQRPGLIANINYRSMLLELLSIIEKANCNDAHLKRIGIDDVITRVIAEFVIAQYGIIHEIEARPTMTRSKMAVDQIYDYVQQNIGLPLTTSKMEKLTGLTGRALNYAFQERFSCSPQEWQRGFLLDEARKRLSRNELMSIKALSGELGFSSASSFAAHYKKRFGELPTETATRAASPSTQTIRPRKIM